MTSVFQSSPFCLLGSDVILQILDYVCDYTAVNFMISNKSHMQPRYIVKKELEFRSLAPEHIKKIYKGRFRFNKMILNCKHGRGSFPDTITQLRFGNSTNVRLGDGKWLPSKLTHLTLGDRFLQCMDFCVFSRSLTYLDLGNGVIGSIEDIQFPPLLTHLIFGKYFNLLSHQYVFPKSLKFLVFGKNFNCPIHECKFPPTLEYIKFGFHFNQPIKTSLFHTNLKHLEVGHCYNQSMETATLPWGLENLIFGYYFNQPMENCNLPLTLSSLTFGDMFNQPLYPFFKFPPALKVLKFGCKFNGSISYCTFPNSITRLEFGFHFNQRIRKGILPAHLEHLTLGWSFQQTLVGVPKSIVRIQLNKSYFREIPSKLNKLIHFN